MGLVRTVAPTKTVLTLPELKHQCAIHGGEHDTYLMRLMQAATAAAERHTGRAFLTQTWRLTLDRFPLHEIRLPRPPLSSVTSIVYTDEDGDEQTLTSSLYVVAADSHPGRITPVQNEVWPSTYLEPESVRVTYVAGYGDDPEDVPEEARQAVAMMAADWFRNRETTTAESLRVVPMGARYLLDGLKTGAQPEWFRQADWTSSPA